jgi:hypothetical protein
MRSTSFVNSAVAELTERAARLRGHRVVPTAVGFSGMLAGSDGRHGPSFRSEPLKRCYREPHGLFRTIVVNWQPVRAAPYLTCVDKVISCRM